jgi:hypothetical protein
MKFDQVISKCFTGFLFKIFTLEMKFDQVISKCFTGWQRQLPTSRDLLQSERFQRVSDQRRLLRRQPGTDFTKLHLGQKPSYTFLS